MRRTVVAAVLAAVVLTGCGGGGSEEAEPTAARAGAQGDPAAYDGIIAALGRARIPVATCPVTNGGGAYEVIPAPAASLASGNPHLQFTDGRLYELGPCETPADQRTLLRIYHFPDGATRDAAVQTFGTRGIRATAGWMYKSDYTVELWQHDPTDTGPVGAAASAAHMAIGGMPGIRHV
jgi:hypothetical protein